MQDEGDEKDEKYSLDSDASDQSDDDDDEEDDRRGGTDLLMTDSMDIPRVDDIPIVSKLAKQKTGQQQKLPKAEELNNNKEKLKKIMDAEEDEYESHFVENPFIKLREKALSKNVDSKKHIREGVLNSENKE